MCSRTDVCFVITSNNKIYDPRDGITLLDEPKYREVLSKTAYKTIDRGVCWLEHFFQICPYYCLLKEFHEEKYMSFCQTCSFSLPTLIVKFLSCLCSSWRGLFELSYIHSCTSWYCVALVQVNKIDLFLFFFIFQTY